MISSFIVHQWRISATLKKVILDKQALKIQLIRYGALGHFERVIEAPI